MKDEILKDMVNSPEEFEVIREAEARRLYLYSAIDWQGYENNDLLYTSYCGWLIRQIMKYNREDEGLQTRKPIMLYINCPGGDVYEGFALADAIAASQTQVYTINMGQWSSMAFMIGITGDKRFSLPHATFLLHDGDFSARGSTHKVIDRAAYLEKYEDKVAKEHVLKYSNLTELEYDGIKLKEYYMLPEEALAHGFIDEIITNLDEIL